MPSNYFGYIVLYKKIIILILLQLRAIPMPVS